jgi:Flp pilus assembly pilin Flp
LLAEVEVAVLTTAAAVVLVATFTTRHSQLLREQLSQLQWEMAVMAVQTRRIPE